ncbi:MAG: hypothetical protein HOQ01_12095 [Lysobacter sp.]|nr:hypothetical protein [Lysobacter sp.]
MPAPSRGNVRAGIGLLLIGVVIAAWGLMQLDVFFDGVTSASTTYGTYKAPAGGVVALLGIHLASRGAMKLFERRR